LTGEADIAVDRSLVLVGRHPHCDARLASIRVSRRHCCLTEVDGEVLVRDLGSTNGVFINGRRRESCRLRPGDVLSIAHVHYRLEECWPARARQPTLGRA
jgi:pSer/pThr/pTyr-binding forkhead associated (FHA) protein